MANKNIQMKNYKNGSWQNLYPVTTDKNVIADNEMLSELLVNIKNVTPWQTAKLQSGWANYSSSGGQYTQFGFKRTSDNTVRFKGLIKDGQNGLLFVLPEGFRPPYRSMFYVGTDSSQLARVDVHATGDVTVEESPSNRWLSLETIEFPL